MRNWDAEAERVHGLARRVPEVCGSDWLAKRRHGCTYGITEANYSSTHEDSFRARRDDKKGAKRKLVAIAGSISLERRSAAATFQKLLSSYRELRKANGGVLTAEII